MSQILCLATLGAPYLRHSPAKLYTVKNTQPRRIFTSHAFDSMDEATRRLGWAEGEGTLTSCPGLLRGKQSGLMSCSGQAYVIQFPFIIEAMSSFRFRDMLDISSRRLCFRFFAPET